MSNHVLDIGCPITHESDGSQALFATAYHAGVMHRLERRVSQDVLTTSIFEVLAGLQRSLPRTALCWQPEIGAVLQRLQENRVDAAVVTGLFAMHALRVGAQWEFDLKEPMWASLAGFIFQLSGHIAVEADEERITVHRGGKPRDAMVFRWTGGTWRTERAADETPALLAPARVEFDGFGDVYVHPWNEPKTAQTDIIVNWPIAADKRGEDAIAALAATNIAAGLQVLSRAGERYLSWVRPLFRGVAATPLTYDDMRQSGSYTLHPGVFNCGFPGGPESIAEVIVHEISHQNFLLLNAVLPLADDQSGERLYSSLKGSERPVSRVLLAYHAAANMALFWKDLSERADLDPYYVAEKTKMEEHVRSLADALSNSNGLTETGQALFRAQQQMLAERSLISC